MAQKLSTNTFGVAKFVVSPDPTQGTHTTISAALLDAVSGDTIWVRDGTYAEDITGVPGVFLTTAEPGSSNSSVTINGQISMTVTGGMQLSGFVLRNNASVVSITGTNVSNLTFVDCNIAGGATAPLSLIANTNGGLGYIRCTIQTGSTAFPIFDHNGGCSISDCLCFSNAATPPSQISSVFLASKTAFTTQFFVTTASGIFSAGYCSWGNAGTSANWITYDTSVNNPENNLLFCAFINSAGTLLTFNNISSEVTLDHCYLQTSAGTVLAGTGSITYAHLSFGGSTTIAPTLNIVGIPARTGALASLTSVTTATSPYTVLPFDIYIYVDSSAGPVSILFPNTPNGGQQWTVKDAAGAAAANNITLTTPGGATLFDGSPALVMNVNYQAVSLVGFSSSGYQVSSGVH